MKITLVCGSLRHEKNSQSLKVARFMQPRIEELALAKAELLDLGKKPYPLWDEGIWDGDEAWNKILEPAGKQLADSDAFVFLVPEYHGMAPSGIKNFLLMHNKYQIGHKPVLLVGVSSSDGGAYPLAELRMNSAKNNRICYIPEQLIIRNAESVLNADESLNDKEADAYFRARIDYALRVLELYANALLSVRASDKLYHDDFNFGM